MMSSVYMSKLIISAQIQIHIYKIVPHVFIEALVKIQEGEMYQGRQI